MVQITLLIPSVFSRRWPGKLEEPVSHSHIIPSWEHTAQSKQGYVLPHLSSDRLLPLARTGAGQAGMPRETVLLSGDPMGSLGDQIVIGALGDQIPRRGIAKFLALPWPPRAAIQWLLAVKLRSDGKECSNEIQQKTGQTTTYKGVDKRFLLSLKSLLTIQKCL